MCFYLNISTIVWVYGYSSITLWFGSLFRFFSFLLINFNSNNSFSLLKKSNSKLQNCLQIYLGKWRNHKKYQKWLDRNDLYRHILFSKYPPSLSLSVSPSRQLSHSLSLSLLFSFYIFLFIYIFILYSAK